jgi:hypothetical protein
MTLKFILIVFLFFISCDTSIESKIAGCTDPFACNYNINAVDDIDNCIFADNNCDICSGENNGYGTVIDNDDDNDGICNIDEKFGCMDEDACNYDEFAEQNDNSCTYESICEECVNGLIIDNDLDNDQICDNVDECIYTTNNDDICNSNVELPYSEQDLMMAQHLDLNFDICYGSDSQTSLKIGDFFGKVIHFNLSASW